MAADQPTAAKTTRAAAARLREAAEKATPGPWRVCAEGSEGSRIAPDYGDIRTMSQWIGIANGRVQPEDGRNAAYIALVNPVVGLAVADWLEAEVALAADPRNHAEVSPTALAVARSLLGGSRD